MSIQAFKRKAVINYGSKRSGKPPGGIWISQGPYGGIGPITVSSSVDALGAEGFSINGGTRNVGGIGKSMAMSKSGTPFRGQFAQGWGGSGGTYKKAQPLLNSPHVRGITSGEQYKYIKPSVLSTKGMLEKKYMWIHNGQYPNYWVQPVNGNDNLADNSSQWLYVQQKAAANDCVNDTNKPEIYEGHRVKCGVTGCQTTTARYTSYNIMAAAGPYTKQVNVPQTSGQYTLRIQRGCANPIGRQKPFPFAVNGLSGCGSGSFYTPPPLNQQIYLTPPAWYWK